MEARIQKATVQLKEDFDRKIYTAPYTHTGRTPDINIRGQGRLTGRRDFFLTSISRIGFKETKEATKTREPRR